MTQFLGTLATEPVIVHVDALLVDLMPEYLDRQIDNVESMIAACGQGDYETIQWLGHEMKGTGAGYGFDGISDIGGRLEQIACEQNSEEVRQLLGALSNYLERVEVVFV